MFYQILKISYLKHSSKKLYVISEPLEHFGTPCNALGAPYTRHILSISFDILKDLYLQPN